MTPGSESTRFQDLAAATRRLYEVVQALQIRAEFLQPVALDGQEWYELLRQKLVPQLGEDPWLVAAVVGGTNIGKSVTFNHLAEEERELLEKLGALRALQLKLEQMEQEILQKLKEMS